MTCSVTYMPRAVKVLAGFAALALAAAGCGGEDDEEDDAKAPFIAAADSICDRLGEDSVAIVEETIGEPERKATPARLRAISEASADLQREALTDLRALTPPPGDEELVTRIWDALERAIDELEAVPLDDPGQPGSPADVALKQYGALASEYGLGTCADGL